MSGRTLDLTEDARLRGIAHADNEQGVQVWVRHHTLLLPQRMSQEAV